MYQRKFKLPPTQGDLFTDDGRPPPCEPAVKSARPPRKKYFTRAAQDVREVAALVRGTMIAHLDDSFLAGPLGTALGRDPDAAPDDLERMVWALTRADDRADVYAVLRGYSYHVLALIQVALFPEEYLDDAETGARIAAVRAARGICPDTGPERVGAARLKTYARFLADVAGRGA